MAGSPAKHIIAQVFGGVVITNDTTPGPASYDTYGQRFVFVPAQDDTAHYAIDVEHKDSPVPSNLVKATGSNDAIFFQDWTQLEVIAKLTDTPILKLVKQPLFQHNTLCNLLIKRCDTAMHWIAVGRHS